MSNTYNVVIEAPGYYNPRLVERAEAAAVEAALYDGPKVDTFAGLASVTSDMLAVDALIRVIETGAVYRRVTSGADLDYTGSGGVMLRAQGALAPEMFATIEAAITAASQTGRALRGTPGATYTFATGVTVTGDLIADFSGCTLKRSASMTNRSALRIAPPLSAATYDDADTITAYSVVDYAFVNGTASAPRITLADVTGYAAGQIVKVLSADKIPCITPWEDTRYAEMAEIEAVDAGNGYIYLTRPFAETWTPTKILRLTETVCDLTGGIWTEAESYPVARNAPMVELHGVIRPRYRDMHFRDTASTQLQLLSCYEPVSTNNRFDNPRHSVVYTAYAYGEKLIGCTRPVQIGATGSGCRHIWDTGGLVVADADLGDASPLVFGAVVDGTVSDGVGYDSLNAPFGDHPDAFGTVFINCRSIYSQRRKSAATLTGLQLRGRKSRAIGGLYEGLKPFQAEPSTNDPMLLKGVTFLKFPAGDTDAAREPAFHIIGGGVVSGKAKIIAEDVRFEQKFGRKEVIRLENAVMEFRGSLEYAASLSNAVFAALDDGSTLTINGLEADFSGSTAATPMLTLLADAASSVFAPGRVTIKGSTAGGSAIVLTDFSSLGGSADWRDVTGDGTFFSNESGWRNSGSATLLRATKRRSDTGAFSGDTTANFSSGSGAKTITWPTGAADPVIYAAINPTTAGTYPGTVPAGVFTGQRLVLSNRGGFDFTVQTTGNISVGATRTVAVGSNIILRWSGSAWEA